ncbi:hypothetical protein BJX70DRAFT_139894 [Aspergillus crustosus]
MSSTTEELPENLTGSDASRANRSREATKKERRRRQNRQNQRSWRDRQRRKREADRLVEECALRQQRQDEEIPISSIPGPLPDIKILATLPRPIAADSCLLPHPRLYQLLAVFEAAAYQSYRGNPQADHLLTLVKLNVFRAFVRNIAALGYTREWMTDDALSRFSVCGPQLETVPQIQDIPTSLHPTELQQRQAHHPWLDFFPFATLRDKLIKNEDTMDESQFCRDLMGFWTMPKEDNCMLVWGDPWDPMNWEITEAFLRKWGGLVKGCPEILWSTNYWRKMRGEKRLVWRASFDTIPVAVA